MPIPIVDGIVVLVVLVSSVLAMVRGFVREVLAVAAWISTLPRSRAAKPGSIRSIMIIQMVGLRLIRANPACLVERGKHYC